MASAQNNGRVARSACADATSRCRGLEACNSKSAQSAFWEWWRGWNSRGGTATEPETNARAAWKAAILWITGTGIDPHAEFVRVETIESLFGMKRGEVVHHLDAGDFTGFRDGKPIYINLPSVRAWFYAQLVESRESRVEGQNPLQVEPVGAQ